MESYQTLISDLESKVNMLGKNELNLEDSLRIYEEAMGLYKKCNQKLCEAETKLLKIKEDSEGNISSEIFTREEASDER